MSLNSRPEFKIGIGDRELVLSAVVHLNGTEPVIVTVANLRVVLTFKTDSAEARYTGFVEDGSLNLELYNHNNSLGEGELSPMEVAIVGGRKLYMTYVASTLNTAAEIRRLEIAFYMGAANA